MRYGLSLVLCGAAGALLLSACTKAEDQQGPVEARRESARLEEKAPPPDSWEIESADEPRDPCKPVDDAFVFPLPEPQRAAAIARLAATEAVSLSEAEALVVAGIQREATGERLARQLLRKEIERLKEERRAVYEDSVGGWNVVAQERLDGLAAYARTNDADRLRPFLVRAIAKHELTGGFVVSVCGDVLSVGHVSLGDFTPPSKRLPVIVFLRKPPKRVHIGWGIAE